MENDIASNKKLANNINNDNPSPPYQAPPTLGHYLACRLVQIGVADIFSVAGDSQLLIAEPGLSLIGCCSELSAGYAADGYARARGVGACFVSGGTVGTVNAVAGAYSEDLPLVCIVGGPHSDHNIGPLPEYWTQQLRCFQTVTCHQAVIRCLESAQRQIDEAIKACVEESKPVYISISCNLVSIPHPTFLHHSLPLLFSPKMSDEMAMEVAVEAAAQILNKAVKPVLVAGPKLRVAKSCHAFVDLSQACGYATAVMPAAKGLVPETLPQFMGTYWGAASSGFCGEMVETADASLFAGPVFDDISTVGHSLLFSKRAAIIAQPEHVVIPGLPTIQQRVLLKDFLKRLTKRLNRNVTAYENYRRIYVPEGCPTQSDAKEALKVNVLFKHVQKMLTGDMVVIAEAGDSWFHCQKLKLPQGCRHENQLIYGSIGWSVGATLGYAQAQPNNRVIAFVGDGSFQMIAQEVWTMLRWEHKSIIFLINNGGYTTEVAIHDGPYNVIKNWNYTAFVDALDNGKGRCWTAKVHCEDEVVGAIKKAMVGDKKNCLCLIEVIVHKDDTAKELLQFASRLRANTSR